MSIRLIDIKTLRLKSFNSAKAPPYAILSHTWVEDEEISFQEMCQISENPNHPAANMSGYRKIEETCRLATNHGLEYAWVDTCCIDKSSSAELSEAINSMFRWYRDAKVCFAYLSDFSLASSDLDLMMKPHTDSSFSNDVLYISSYDLKKNSGMEGCKWFTRGWCLQELIAPKHMIFYNKAWLEVGTKSTLMECITSITRVDKNVLEDHTDMYSLPVARRMSWASGRITTRVEDIAYCLLGIFDINMPMLYGEGEKAFSRLQEEITRRFNDTSIFLFSPKKLPAQISYSPRAATPQAKGKRKPGDISLTPDSKASHMTNLKLSATEYVEELSTYQFCDMFANSPADFDDCGDIVYKPGSRALFDRKAFSVTNRGVQLGEHLLWCDWGKYCFIWETAFHHSNYINHVSNGAIFLRKIGRNLFTRVLLPRADISSARYIFHEDVCILPHITPSTCEQMFNTLEAVLRIQVESPRGLNVSFSQQTPLDTWDESGKLFLFPENLSSSGSNLSFNGNSFTRSVQVSVKQDGVEDVNFYLRFLLRHHHPKGNEAFVLLSRDPATKSRRSYGEDSFDEYLQVLLKARTLSAESHQAFEGLNLDAHIYRDRKQGWPSRGFTCSVEISSDYNLRPRLK